MTARPAVKHWFSGLKGCPKCGLAFSTLLFPFCQNKGCPPRVWRKISEGKATAEDVELSETWRREVEASGTTGIMHTK